MNNVTITVDGEEQVYPRGVTVEIVLQRNRGAPPFFSLGAALHNHLLDPDYTLNDDCSLRLLTSRDREGFAIYRRSATLILIEAVHRLFPDRRLFIGQSLADGYYFDSGVPLEKPDIDRIGETVRAIIREDLPFTRHYLSYGEARKYFESRGLSDKISLLEFYRSPEICLVRCGKALEFYTGPSAPSTGRITILALEPYADGFILRFPTWEEQSVIPPMRLEKKLFAVYQESRAWNRILSVENVGQLNNLCVTGKIRELIMVAEALHAKKIAAIADEISRRGEPVKLALIAGPSGSGKTTFAKRLSIQLRVNGLDPVIISMDNYFKDREATPRDTNGERDFESLKAVDLALFTRHLGELIAGERIQAPRFDFKRGTRRDDFIPIQLTPGKILLIEGNHCLNDRVTSSVPSRNKFLIYISALTQLRLDNHTRIFTSDTRLLRRIVRDRIFRGWSALDTIRRWPLVRRGERINIFPFQENADILFNSALVYEYAVLKNYAELALLDTTPEYPEYVEVERLLSFLSWFAPISERDVPSTSILREFIGESIFDY
ncbi:MAG: nucleoside kinase [PVC group bacterium]